ncbi:hypothetical protein MHU86_1576 [Fragilaria crotonensis]|nr:hypothetical protein MHU86_1576 [Fragilaria crotonensis]
MMPDSTPLTNNGARSHTHLSIPFETRNADAFDGLDHPIPTPRTVESIKKTSTSSGRKSDRKHKEKYSNREIDAKQKALDPTGDLSNSLSSLTLPFSDDHRVDEGDSKHVHAKRKSRRKSKRSSKPTNDLSQSQSAEMNDSHKSMNSSSSSLDWRRLRDDSYKPEKIRDIRNNKEKEKRTVQDNHEQSSKETEVEPSMTAHATNSFDNSRTSNRSDTTPNVSNTDGITKTRPVAISVPPDVVQSSHATTSTTATVPTRQIQQVQQVQQGPSNGGVAKSQVLRRYSNPATMIPQEPGFVTLPEALTVILPSGPLGVAFKNQNNTTVVWSLKEDSPVLLNMKVGMVVDTLTLPADGIELRGLDSAELCKAINNSTNMEGRFLLLKSPFSPRLPKLATSKILLPPEGNADDLGLVIVGDPARLKEVATTSPLHGKAVAGQQILALGLGDGTAYLRLRSFEFKDFLQETSGIQGRFLVLKNLKQRTSPTTAAPAAAAPPPTKVVNERPGFLKALSQRWGSNRSLFGMDDSSRGSVRRRSFGGYSANNDRFSVSSHDRLSGSTSRAMEQRRYSNTELIATGFVTFPKSLSVVLPTGKLGVVFQNQNDTTVVLCMKEDSPMLIDLVAGMVVDTLTLPGGNELRGLCTSELCKALNSTIEFEGRTMLLKSPHSMDLPAIATTKIMLDVLGDGRDLGLLVEGYPAAVTEIASTSPLVGMVLPGQQLLSIGLKSGAEYNMPTCAEVQSLLQNIRNDAPSFLLLKNSTQRTQKLQMSESSCGVVIQGSQRFRRTVARRWSSSGIDTTMDYSNGSARRLDSLSSHSSGARLSIRTLVDPSDNSDRLEASSGVEADTNATLYKKLVIPLHQGSLGETSQEQADMIIDESEKKSRKSGRRKKSTRRSKSLESPKRLGSESVTLPASTLDELVESSRGSRRRRSRRHRDVPDVSSTEATSTSQLLRSRAKPGLDVGVASNMLDESEQSNASRTSMTLNSNKAMPPERQ